MKQSSAKPAKANLAKCPTGIKGFDEITGGGLPAGRPTLVCGNAGCGKTILSTEFLVHGTLEYDEPGVFMAFEETAEELMQNAASLGFDLAKLVSRKKMVIDFVRVERNEIEETKSMAALDNLRALCKEHMPGQYDIEIIDLLRQPQLARGDQIIAIPTLVRKLPEPMKKLLEIFPTLIGRWLDWICGRPRRVQARLEMMTSLRSKRAAVEALRTL